MSGVQSSQEPFLSSEHTSRCACDFVGLLSAVKIPEKPVREYVIPCSIPCYAAATMALHGHSMILLCLICLVLLSKPAAAFGAGNIASISRIEGHNWRHGDIEDMLKTVACLKGYKWTSMMVKRVYFGNWLRDYSQAVDVGTLKGVQADAIRVLVWILAFMSFGYATEEFEVTSDRLGVYRPEEHIDHPAGYADGVDARQYDARLRPPVDPEEIAVDTETGALLNVCLASAMSQLAELSLPL